MNKLEEVLDNIARSPFSCSFCANKGENGTCGYTCYEGIYTPHFEWGGFNGPRDEFITAPAYDKNQLAMIDTNIFDEVEYHFNCAVQILKNSMTSETSIAWVPMDSPLAEIWKEDDDYE